DTVLSRQATTARGTGSQLARAFWALIQRTLRANDGRTSALETSGRTSQAAALFAAIHAAPRRRHFSDDGDGRDRISHRVFDSAGTRRRSESAIDSAEADSLPDSLEWPHRILEFLRSYSHPSRLERFRAGARVVIFHEGAG